MPVILGPADHGLWLDPGAARDALRALLRPAPDLDHLAVQDVGGQAAAPPEWGAVPAGGLRPVPREVGAAVARHLGDRLEPGQEVRGSLPIKPSGSAAGVGSAAAIGAYDLFVDGRLVVRIPPGQSVELDTTKLADGYHELTLVGVLAGPIGFIGIVVPHLVRLMVGGRLDDLYPRSARAIGEAVLEVTDVVPGHASFALHRVRMRPTTCSAVRPLPTPTVL